MLPPEQMTDQTLSAIIALYSAHRDSQPDDFTEEDRLRAESLVQERDRRIALQDTLPDGIYVTRAWAAEPHKGLMWVRQNARWDRLTIAYGGALLNSDNIATPQTFYGLGWEKYIVALVAAS